MLLIHSIIIIEYVNSLTSSYSLYKGIAECGQSGGVVYIPQ